ncbi:MAG: hypothetical protein M3500_16200 [Actinomycetota bacterium]|nr:hypothetical protein [Actinomycetota bacterium]
MSATDKRGLTARWAELRTYWSWGPVLRATGPREMRAIYGAWLLAFVLKVLGSSWDVSWHFKWLRDDLAPPHLLNSAGTALVVALVVFHTYTGFGVDRIALRFMQWGIGLFLLAVPLDLVNHAAFGLDITSWSPTHAVLYLGTAVMLVGVLRGWWLGSEPGRRRNVVMLALWFFFVENVLFPNQHQEYGVLSLRAFDGGESTAEPILLDFARAQGSSPAEFMLPVPSWVHPAWLVCAGLLTLVVARRTTRITWAATIVAAVYLTYRSVAWVLLVAGDFPPSAVPYMLLAGAVVIDVATRYRLNAAAGAVAVTVATYATARLMDELAVIPPWHWWSAPAVAVVLAAEWYAVDRILDGPVGVRWSRPVGPAHRPPPQPL